MEIHDPREWRLSKSGFSIKTGWATESKIVAGYTGVTSPRDVERFKEWLENAEIICSLHNATLRPSEVDQLRAKVAELTAEVARLQVPVELVWQRGGGDLRSQDFSWGRYEVQTRYWGGFYPRLCAATEESILTGGSANAGSEDAAIAACVSHHTARWHEMQGASK